MSHHKLISSILAAALLSGLVACSSFGEFPSSSPSAEKVVLTFMASQDWVQDAELSLARKFDKETGIGVNYQIFPSDQYTNLLMIKLNTGECPDIFAAQSGRFDLESQLNVQKNAVDLSDTDWAKRVEALAAAELTVDEKLYGQPIQDISAVWAIAYNKQIFHRLHLSVPRSFEEFTAVCDTLQKNGITPIYECLSDGWHHTLWFLESCISQEKISPGYKERLNNNTAVFAENECFLQILEQMKTMVSKGYWGDSYVSNTYADTAKEMAAEHYAMVIFNQGLGEEVHAVNPQIDAEDIGYFVIPLADNQSLNINPAGPARFIYSGTQNLEEALLYFDFLASQESLSYLTESVAKYNHLPFIDAPQTYTDTIRNFYNSYDDKAVVYQTAVKYVNPQWTDIGNDLAQMLAGDISPNQVLKNIDTRRAEQAFIEGDPDWY